MQPPDRLDTVIDKQPTVDCAPVVVVFSGGQDSTTCLIHTLQHPPTAAPQQIHCLTVDYGQRHWAEIATAQALARHFGITHHRLLDATLLNQLSDSSLIRADIALPLPLESQPEPPLMPGLPNTFVPGRNILFLTLAAIYAHQVGAQRIIIGVCETDFSGYPDCRAQFIHALNPALNLGLGRQLYIETPLMRLNKAETWALADYYGQLEIVRHQTLTCYHGQLGDGCGHCQACHLRSRGLRRYQRDPQHYLASLREKMVLPSMQ